MKMNVIYKKHCRICLSSGTKINLTESTLYKIFYKQVLDVEVSSLELYLCIMCKVIVKKTMHFIATAKKSHTKLSQSKIDVENMKCYNKLTIHYKNHYDATFCHSYSNDSISSPKKASNFETINFISINEIMDEEIDSDLCENKLDITEKEINVTKNEIAAEKFIQNEITSDAPQKETKIKLGEINVPLKEGYKKQNASASLKINNHEIYRGKEVDYKNLNFKVEYLTKQEQINEILKKKQSEKYRNMKYHCDKCGIGFLTRDVFEEHLKRHEEVAGPHKCQTCTLRFKSKEVLSQHSLCHRRRFTCLQCHSRFTRRAHCMAHRQQCGFTTVQSPVGCRRCGKMFGNEQSLRIHVKGVHESVHRYSCDQCGKKFTNKQRLHVHVRTHSGVKEFECSKCTQRFSTHSNLRAHAAVHESVKTHYCVECNTYYKTLKGLKRHFKESTRHAVKESLIYPCPKCSKSFATEKSLDSHVIGRHLTDNICGICKKSFSSKANLRKHERSIHGAN